MSHRRTGQDRPGPPDYYISPPIDEVDSERSQWEATLVNNLYPPLQPDPAGDTSVWAADSLPSPPRRPGSHRNPPRESAQASTPAQAPPRRPAARRMTPEEAERRRLDREAASWRPPRALRPPGLELAGAALRNTASDTVKSLRAIVLRSEARKKMPANKSAEQTEPLEEGWSDEDEDIEAGWEVLDADPSKARSERPWPGQLDDKTVAKRINHQFAVGAIKVKKASGFDETMAAINEEVSHFKNLASKKLGSQK